MKLSEKIQIMWNYHMIIKKNYLILLKKMHKGKKISAKNWKCKKILICSNQIDLELNL